MLKRINWKAIFISLTWAVCLSGLVVLMSFIEVKKQDVKCTSVKILIPGADNFIERDEINAILKQGYGELTGRLLEDINIHAVEQRIKANPFIAFVKVYADMDGVIRIRVKQRQPVLRVINAASQDFYIDEEGFKMPVSANFTANVLVATGNILEPFGGKVEKIRSRMLYDLYRTAVYIKKDTLWDAQIEQLFVDESTDIELVPRVGIQKIIIGNADQLDVKMKNLLAFYKKAMPRVGWDTYKTINVKYTNQIVCEKNKIDSAALSKIAMQRNSTLLGKQVQDSMINESIQQEIKAMQNNSADAAEDQVVKISGDKKETKKPETIKPEAVPANKKPAAQPLKDPKVPGEKKVTADPGKKNTPDKEKINKTQ